MIASIRNDVVLVVAFKVEADLEAGGNVDTFFNNGIANSSVLSDPGARHQNGGLNRTAVFNPDAGGENRSRHSAIRAQACMDWRQT